MAITYTLQATSFEAEGDNITEVQWRITGTDGTMVTDSDGSTRENTWFENGYTAAIDSSSKLPSASAATQKDLEDWLMKEIPKEKIDAYKASIATVINNTATRSQKRSISFV